VESADPPGLLDAVRRVAAGESYVQRSVGAALDRWDEIPRRHDHDSLFSLTTREQEVLELLALGHTRAEAAKASVLLRRPRDVMASSHRRCRRVERGRS
jgi:DNA-binding NarL/FixJ family response regulator